MPDFEGADLAGVNLAHVGKELRNLRPEFRRGRRRLAGRHGRPELDVAHRDGPRVEDQFAAADLEVFKAAEAELLHGGDERHLGRQQVLGRDGRGHRATAAMPPPAWRLRSHSFTSDGA